MRTTMFLLITLLGILLIKDGFKKNNIIFKIGGFILLLPFVLFVYTMLIK